MIYIYLKHAAIVLYVSAVVLSFVFGFYNQFVMTDNIIKEKKRSAYILGFVNFRPSLLNERGNKARIRFNMSAMIFILLVGVPILLMAYYDISSVLSVDQAILLADKKFKEYCREMKEDDCGVFSRYSTERYKAGWLIEYKNTSGISLVFLVHDDKYVEVSRFKEGPDRDLSDKLHHSN